MIASLPRGWIYTTIGEVTKDNVRQHRPKLEEKFRYINISSIDRKTKQIIEAQQLLGKMRRVVHAE